MTVDRHAWAAALTLFTLSAHAGARPMNWTEQPDGSATLAAAVQGLEPLMLPQQRGPELHFTGHPEARLVFKPWQSGRELPQLSLGEPQLNVIEDHLLRWSVPALEQTFEGTTTGIAWTLELGWKPPSAESLGPAFLDLALESDGVELQERGNRLFVEVTGSSEPLAIIDGLAMRDASGRELPTQLRVVGGYGASFMRIEYDDTGSSAPFRLDLQIRGGSTWLEPVARGSAFGRRVAAAGDVNGDGRADLLVSARLTETGVVEGGRVMLHLGAADGIGFDADWTLDGVVASGRLGADIAGAGDVNGDGFDDLLVGEPGARRCLLFLGGPTGPADVPDWTFTTVAGNTDLGWATALPGDLDGDGFDEVVLGEPRANGAAGLETGRVLIFRGSPTGPGTNPDQIVEGEQGFSRFGEAVAGAGDVDGDGRQDLLVGAPLHDSSRDDAGLALLFHGAVGGVDPDRLVLREGVDIGGRCGERLAGLGDLDGDGFSDFAASCPGEGPGEVEVFFGPDLLRRRSLVGLEDGERFGASLAGGADLDGDGRPELIVGAPARDSSRGVVQVFTFLGRQLVPQPILTRSGEREITETGISVAALGDVDRDGFGELAIGSWYATGEPGWATGRVEVLRGRGWGAPQQGLGELESLDEDDGFGKQLVRAGDVNGDGYFDLLVVAREGDAQDGDVRLYFGGPEGLTEGRVWLPERVFPTVSSLTAAGVGDVNGDGFDDLLLGGPLFSNFLTRRGAAALFLGGPNGPGSLPNWALVGDAAEEQLGGAVAPAGDLNGDGLADFLVLSRTQSAVQVFHGTATLPLGEPAVILSGGVPPPGGEEGRAAVGVGDLNRDGFDDLVLASVSPTRPHVFYGSPTGVSLLPDEILNGSAIEISALGDLTGDGLPEFGVRKAAHSWDIWSGSAAGLWRISGASRVEADWLEPAGDVDGDGRDDLLVRLRNWRRTWELRSVGVDGLLREPRWKRSPLEGPRREIGAATGLDANGDGLSDLFVGWLGEGSGAPGLIEAHPGSSGAGSRRAPVLTRREGAGPRLREGQRGSLDERLRVEFGLDVPGDRQDVVIEWLDEPGALSSQTSTGLDSGPPPGAPPAPARRAATSVELAEEGRWRPRYRLVGAQPVPWVSPWYRLPPLGGSLELRVAANRPPTCGFTAELVSASMLFLQSTADDPDRDPLQETWDLSSCFSATIEGLDEAAGTALVFFDDCGGSCEVGLESVDPEGASASCRADVSWSALGASAGPDVVLDCTQPSVQLFGSASLADPAHALLVHWEPAALVSDPSSFTPTTATPGDYSLTVTDTVTGCVNSDVVRVIDDVDSFAVNVRLEQGLDCLHRSAVLVAEPSMPDDYSFSWSPRFAFPDPDAQEVTTSLAGELTVVVRNLRTGCEVTERFELVDGATAEPSSLDLRPGVEPLRLARDSVGGRLVVTWEDTGAADWSVFRGSVRSLVEDGRYDHAPIGACHLPVASASVSIPPVDSYYLVATDCGAALAFGRDSGGRERGPALAACP